MKSRVLRQRLVTSVLTAVAAVALAAEVIDNDPRQQDFLGILGLQLHSGPPMTVQFKDVRLKILSCSSSGSPHLQ